jgi:hypothetical protein
MSIIYNAAFLVLRGVAGVVVWTLVGLLFPRFFWRCNGIKDE